MRTRRPNGCAARGVGASSASHRARWGFAWRSVVAMPLVEAGCTVAMVGFLCRARTDRSPGRAGSFRPVELAPRSWSKALTHIRTETVLALSAGSTAYTFRSRNFFGQAYDERGPSILDCSRSTKEQRPRNPRFSQIMVRANGAEIFLSRGNTRGVSNGACLGRD
jgi:hypothetical protein